MTGTRALAVVVLVFLGSLAGAALAVRLVFNASAQDLCGLVAVLAGAGAVGAVLSFLIGRQAAALPAAVAVGLWCLASVLAVLAAIAGAGLLMFVSSHDLNFLLILVAFSAAVSVTSSVIAGYSAQRRWRAFESAAERFGSGESGVRIPALGRDQLAHVAVAFNVMAENVERAEADRRKVESARRELFAAVSHDLRTPLATTRAMVEALGDEVVTDAATRSRYLRSISIELQRLSQLIDDLFELARLDSGELRLEMDEVRVDLLVAEAVDAFRRSAEQAGVRLELEAAERMVVQADAARVTRALYNLVQNAIRHTPADGAVTVRAARTADGVAIEVSDTGEGIDPVDLPHVFERFYRGERSRSRETGGAGLGLAIVRSIVEAHGGRVRAESRPREGSRFVVTLPAGR